MDGFTRDGLTFDVRADGPPDGPAVVLLHGFPQDASAYDAVVPLLAAAGLRTLAPDQRGYSPRARPPGRRASTLRELVADVVALLDAAGVAQAHVVTYVTAGRDPFFAPASVEATGRYVDGPFTRVDLDADHWLPEHRPAEVAEAVLARVSA